MNVETKCLKKAYRDSTSKLPLKTWASNVAALTEVTHPGELVARDIAAAKAWLKNKRGA